MEWLIINLIHIIKQRSVKHGLGFENNRYGRSYAGTLCGNCKFCCSNQISIKE